MDASKKTRTTRHSTVILSIGKHELPLNISYLRTQARVVGGLENDQRMTKAQAKALKGLWNFLHAILDATDTETAKTLKQ